MLHGPCGPLATDASCMKNGKCSKGYPKEYCKQTILTSDGYPTYRRMDNRGFNHYSINNSTMGSPQMCRQASHEEDRSPCVVKIWKTHTCTKNHAPPPPRSKKSMSKAKDLPEAEDAEYY